MGTFGYRINQNGGYYILNIDFDVLKFLDNLNDADFVDDQINLPLVVEELPYCVTLMMMCPTP